MLIVPYSSDAPAYHWPIATWLLIGVNTAAFVLTLSMGDEATQSYALRYGSGLHPLQWLTSLFMHAGIVHLVGNMIFLWVFGFIVEGKIGWFWMLVVYLAIGVLECAIEQTIMLRASSEGYSVGASAAIFGLMAIALVWAPANEVHCLWFWRFRAIQVDISVIWFAIMNLAFQFLDAILAKLRMSSEVIHLMGAALGLGVGVAMFKMGMADCEGWDLFSVMAGRGRGLSDKGSTLTKKSRKSKKAKSAEQEPKLSVEERSARATLKVRRLIEEGDAGAAVQTVERVSKSIPGWELAQADWLALIKLINQHKMLHDATPLLQSYVKRFPDDSAKVGLLLGQVFIEQSKPAKALRYLRDVPESELVGKLLQVRSSLVKKAEALQAEGVLEIDDEV